MSFKVPIGYGIKGENTEVIYDDESTWIWTGVEDSSDDSGGDGGDDGGDDSGDDRNWTIVFDSDITILQSTVNYFYESGFEDGINEGETYRVTWGANTEPYLCESFAYEGSYTGYAIGNQDFIGGEDSGEPFFIRMAERNMIVGGTTSPEGSLHLFVEKEVV